MQLPETRRGLLMGAALASLLIVTGCQTLNTEPPPASTTMAGDWRVDAANSDDFDRKLAEVVQQARRHDMPRAPMPTGQPSGSGATVIQPLPMPMEETDKMRTRLADDLRPANRLQIAFFQEGLEITRDSEPVRQYLPAQSVSRIDSSGAFTVSCGWDQGAFVVRAKYTTRGTRTWRIEHDTATDTVRVTFSVNNPQYGHVEMHTLYRRTTEGSN